MRFWVSSVFFSLLALAALAQERPVTSAFTVEVGSAHLCDTYLTPLHYSGWNAAFSYERFQAMRFDPENWIMRLDGRLDIDHTENPARNATMWDLDLRLGWSMMRRWRLPYGITLAAGGATSIDGGVRYLARNGNNPVSAKGAWNVSLTGMATWNVRLGRLPVTLRYQPEMPLTGIFFSPQYGELYYEIWLGDRNGLVHFAWPGNYFVLDNLLTADLRFGATALRLGYRGRVASSKVNNIVTRDITHAFVIGVSGEWISLSPKRTAVDERIISAYY